MTEKKTVKKKGNPSQYKPEYCEMVIEHMRNGMPFESFASVVDVARATLYKWQDAHPEFKEAHSIGVSHHFHYMLKAAKEGQWNYQGEGSRNLNFPLWRFLMKNIHGYRDTIDAEQKTEVNVTGMTTEELEKIVTQAASDIKRKKWPK